MGLIRLVVFGYLGLAVLYLAISIYSKSVRREKLEKRWDAKAAEADSPDGGDASARDAYINEGMARYQASFRPKLIGLVFVVPTVFVIVTLIWNNAQ